jgi:hypothetical protein
VLRGTIRCADLYHIIHRPFHRAHVCERHSHSHNISPSFRLVHVCERYSRSHNISHRPLVVCVCANGTVTHTTQLTILFIVCPCANGTVTPTQTRSSARSQTAMSSGETERRIARTVSGWGFLTTRRSKATLCSATATELRLTMASTTLSLVSQLQPTTIIIIIDCRRHLSLSMKRTTQSLVSQLQPTTTTIIIIIID